MQLLKFELSKIFKQIIIYITFVFLVFLSSSYISNFDKNHEMKEDIYKEWTGGITEEKLVKSQNEYEKLIKIVDARSVESGQRFTELEGIKMGLFEEIGFVRNLEQNSFERLKKLENENNYNTELEAKMIKNLELDYFAYNTAPREIIDYTGTFSFLITGAMILIGISSIYTREYSSGVDNYILSSKKGRRTLVWAKIGASLIYTFIVVFTWETINLLTKSSILGTSGWKTPMQQVFKYSDSPYGLNMLEFHSIQLGIHLMTTISFALFVILVSSLCKNSLISFFVSGAVFAAPYMIIEMVPMPYWLFELFQFTFVHIMRAEFLFANFKTVNFFGQPILYPLVAVTLMIVLSVIFITTNFKLMANKEVSS